MPRNDTVGLTDSHAHLDMQDFARDRAQVVARAREGGVGRILTVGIDFDSSAAAVELAQAHEGVYAAVGYHPHSAGEWDPSRIADLVELTAHPEVVAWGEIGLDFFRSYARPEDQLPVFQRQLAAARDLGLPVIIHDREAHADVLRELTRLGKGERRGVIHCFSGDVDLAQKLMDLGYYISIPGTVTYKKAYQVREVAMAIPFERLLIETDAPFLTPVPFRGQRNEPLYVRHTAQEIARLRGISFDALARQTTQNASDLFGMV